MRASALGDTAGRWRSKTTPTGSLELQAHPSAGRENTCWPLQRDSGPLGYETESIKPVLPHGPRSLWLRSRRWLGSYWTWTGPGWLSTTHERERLYSPSQTSSLRERSHTSAAPVRSTHWKCCQHGSLLRPNDVKNVPLSISFLKSFVEILAMSEYLTHCPVVWLLLQRTSNSQIFSYQPWLELMIEKNSCALILHSQNSSDTLPLL